MHQEHCVSQNSGCISQLHEETQHCFGNTECEHASLHMLTEYHLQQTFFAVGQKPIIKSWIQFLPTRFQKGKIYIEIIFVNFICNTLLNNIYSLLPTNVRYYL